MKLLYGKNNENILNNKKDMGMILLILEHSCCIQYIDVC